jgi:hypothetical protein
MANITIRRCGQLAHGAVSLHTLKSLSFGYAREGFRMSSNVNRFSGKGPRPICPRTFHEFGSLNVLMWACAVSSFALWHVGSSFAQNSIEQGGSEISLAIHRVPVTGAPVTGAPITQANTAATAVSSGIAYANGETIVSETATPASFTSSPSPATSVSYSSPSYVSSTGPAVVRNWALEVATAQMNLDAGRLPNIGLARQRLDQAMLGLENFLATSPQHQANWLNFLTWNDLRSELEKAQPDQNALNQIEKTFRQNYFGLEMRHFTHVRDSLKNYILALRYSSDQAKSMEILNNRLKKLSEQVQMAGFTQDFAITRDIGQTLAYLSQSQQTPTLVSSVRSNFARSNIRVLVSSEFVNRKFSRPVNETNPVNEVILGTQLFGQSLLQGWVTPQLMDSSARAAIKLNLSGNFASQNIGYNRSVKLHTQGFANIAASETIALTDEGLVPLNDTNVDAQLSSQIDSIEARLGLVRRIASKQAAKQKPQADAIGEGRLENRVRSQFHSQLVNQLSQANSKIKTPDLPVLSRLGLQRPMRTTWSSSQYLALLWKLQDSDQLAAPASCPLVVDASGITLQIHESVITNLTDPILAGRILRSAEMSTYASQFGDALGATSLLKKEEEQPWAITMDNYHPVEIQLDNSLITFRIRTTKLDRGDQELDQPASIEASYLLSLNDGAIQLDRQGEVKIDFSGKQQRGVRAVTLRSFLKKKFDDVFKPQLLETPLRISERLPSELQGLQLASVQVDDGWIQVSLR